MNTIRARWETEELRLWAGSALAALLAHLAVAALLFVRIPLTPQRSAGSPVALDVDLASISSPAPAATTSPGQTASQASQGRSSPKDLQLAVAGPVRPLPEMQPLPQPDAAPANAAPPADTGTLSAAVGLSDAGSSDPAEQLWLSEIKARLQSYKEYPSGAVQAAQQDTVTLQFSVDQAGQVTSSRTDSTHHYQALEQEVQRMLRLAAPLPTPPPQLSARNVVVTVPVQFSLTFRAAPACSGSHCRPVRGATKLQATPISPSTLASCTAPANPGPAPAGGTATLVQMQAYRERLNQFLAASGDQLACLSQVRDAAAMALRATLTRQLHSMVDDFNAQAQQFESAAQAQALQAQQERQRQTQALAAKTYAACSPPVVPAAPAAPAALTADGAQSYRRQLIGYQSAVRSYVACLRQADLAATAPDRGLARDQSAQLHETATQLGNAAILPFNQLAARFNAQVPHLQQQALAAQEQNLAEAVVRGTAIFPNSTWSVPAPLPADECIYITRFGQTYHAQLCNPTYVARVSGLPQLLHSDENAVIASGGNPTAAVASNLAADAILPAATQQEGIAALHGFPADNCPPTAYCPPPILGIAVAPEAGSAQRVQQTGPRLQTTSYSVSELQVTGRHISLTISRRSDEGSGSDDSSTVHFDLMLSANRRSLRGVCSTGQQRWECTLPLHR